MLKLHFKTAIVSIVRRRLSSLVSIVSLAIGIAVSILIAVFLMFETSYDRQYPDAERLYRINWVNTNTGARFATFFNPISAQLADAMPDKIESLTRFTESSELMTINGEQQYAPLTFVDANMFETFPQDQLYGDVNASLQDLSTAVISRSAALKYFGREMAIGEVITIGDDNVFRIGAVVADAPLNRHYNAHIFVNIETIPTVYNWPNFWERDGSDQLYHFVKLAEGVRPGELETRIVDYIAQNHFEDAKEWLHTPLQPVADIHFSTETQNEVSLKDELTGIVKNQRQENDLYIFAIVGLLTMAIAAFNFMNLQIVQVTNRLREIGVRKVLGATRQNTAVQFVIECMLLAVLSALLGLAIAEMALPQFATLVGSPVNAMNVFTLDLITFAVGAALVVAVVAGLYPALFAARLLPSSALREEINNQVGITKVRYTLVAAQFAIAAGLVIASSIIGSQVDYALSKPLGFDGTGVIKLNTSAGEARKSYSALKARLAQHPAIETVSAADIVPGQDLENGRSFAPEGSLDERFLATRTVTLAPGATDLLNMKVLAGRSFSEQYPSDQLLNFSDEQTRYESVLLLNETAVKAAGWKSNEEAIGALLTSRFNFRGKDFEFIYTVVGVVADTHYRSVRTSISPISYIWTNSAERQMLLKAVPGREQEALRAATSAFADLVPSIPPRASFLAQDYAAFYEGENRTFALILTFAAIAIVVACVGLYGVTSYMVSRRVREIGIRKVLGATIAQLVALLSWKQTRLALIASIAVWPLVWIFMHDWLQNFAYRADMQFTPFVLASFLTVSLAAITTGVRTYLAARVKPIHSLRHD